MGILFAATYPDRCWALVLYGGIARQLRAPDYPWGPTEAEYRQWIAEEKTWFTTPGAIEEVCRQAAPNAPDDEIRALAAHTRYAFSPQASEDLMRMNMEIDVRKALPAIRVPTLVMHRTGDPRCNVEAGRYLSNHIPGVKYIELPGNDHGFLEIADRVIAEIEEFLTGSRGEVEIDRVLATVLFTDIVDSTKRAAELGDRQWRSLLDRHDNAVRQQLARFRGQEVKNLGDGFMATFDGPARAVRCATAILDAMQPLGIAVRSGLHTGEIELKHDDVADIAVHIAARVAAEAEAGETVV